MIKLIKKALLLGIQNFYFCEFKKEYLTLFTIINLHESTY